MGEGERQLLQWVALGAIVMAVRQFVLWIRDAQPRPDPWGAELETALQNEDIPLTCPHCSATHTEADYFCPGCGKSVGVYSNYSPYLYIFTLGDIMRRGTGEPFRVNWLTIGGYIFMSLQYFSVLSLAGGLFWLAELGKAAASTSAWVVVPMTLLYVLSMVLAAVCIWLPVVYCYQLAQNVRRLLQQTPQP
jgi:hypothetical protein